MTKNLLTLKEENKHNNLILVSKDPLERKSDDIQFMNYEKFLDRLSKGSI